MNELLHHQRNPGMMIPLSTNQQWFGMVCKWCRISSIQWFGILLVPVPSTPPNAGPCSVRSLLLPSDWSAESSSGGNRGRSAGSTSRSIGLARQSFRMVTGCFQALAKQSEHETSSTNASLLCNDWHNDETQLCLFLFFLSPPLTGGCGLQQRRTEVHTRPACRSPRHATSHHSRHGS